MVLKSRWDAARNFQEAMRDRCFVVRVSSRYWLYDNGDERTFNISEREQARLRASGLPEEFER